MARVHEIGKHHASWRFGNESVHLTPLSCVQMNTDTWSHVASYCNLRDLARLSITCTKLRQFSWPEFQGACQTIVSQGVQVATWQDRRNVIARLMRHSQPSPRFIPDVMVKTGTYSPAAMTLLSWCCPAMFRVWPATDQHVDRWSVPRMCWTVRQIVTSGAGAHVVACRMLLETFNECVVNELVDSAQLSMIEEVMVILHACRWRPASPVRLMHKSLGIKRIVLRVFFEGGARPRRG